MKQELYDMRDDEIRILGYSPESNSHKQRAGKLWLLLIAVVLLIAVAFMYLMRTPADEPEPALFEATPISPDTIVERKHFGRVVDDTVAGFCEIKDTIINDIPLKIYIPHNADMTLHVGRVSQNDKDIVYVAQAADVRADNGGIVGAFVLKGRPLAWGLSKRGYCASINGEITVGVADNSPLFEKATEEGGYFFRQYPLVNGRTIVENEHKGKSVRRGICSRIGEIFMVETLTSESFHDFSQALVDLGVDNAVYLVGSAAHGWAIDEQGERHEWGIENIYRGRRRMPKNTSYIVWRRQ